MMSNRWIALLFGVCLGLPCQAQKKAKPGTPTPAEVRMQNEEIRAELEALSTVNGIPFRNVGPTIMSGRVTDVAVSPFDATKFYVAYASGGLWYTDNNGATFEPVFDDEITLTIGAIAVDWNSGTIWIGSGENNSSRSSYSGTGMYKSSDRGESWEYMGLPESHHIGEIKIHPENPDIVWVGVLGHLYSSNEERGLYMTENGGKSWTRTLYINDNSGVIDMEVDPADPTHLYAATWDRTRRAWDFTEGGLGSKIHESNDGGKTWKAITGGDTGFPNDENTGRIGLTISRGNDGKTKLYAILDNQNRQEPEEKADEGLTKFDFENMSVEKFNTLENVDIQTFLEENGFPAKYDTTYIQSAVAEGTLNPNALYEYLTDANASLFDRPVIGAQVYALDENGKWTITHDEPLDDVVYSYGYYFGLIEAHPSNPDILFIAGVPILKSTDGGASWEGINAENMHVDHHSIWVDPNREGHLIIGNDGGINISYDYGKSYFKCNSPAVGQFYSINVDDADPYNVYGGLQDNGVWKGPSDYEANVAWHQGGRYPFEELIGGDGMRVEIDERDNDIVYTGYQFGHYYRINMETEDYHYFHPSHELGERPLRWNWQTPVVLSSHNNDIVYMGSNRFHRSMDKGDTWETLSDDLTAGGVAGDVPFGSLTIIEESKLQFGLIYCGSDDGKVHLSTDAGTTWSDITGKLPEGLWVTRIVASQHELDRVYVSLNGYRNDDFNAYLYKSEDRGKTWSAIGKNLPFEPINVVKEDPMNENLLYLGTDNGLYVSTDGGASFMGMTGNLPPVAVHDLVIQEREQDLVIGTHGRSIYIADIQHLQEMVNSEKELAVFELNTVGHRESWGEGMWSKWLGFIEPEITIPMMTLSGHSANVEIRSDSGIVMTSWVADSLSKGVNYLTYDLSTSPEALKLLTGDEQSPEAKPNGKHYLIPGSYTVTIQVGELKAENTLVIE